MRRNKLQLQLREKELTTLRISLRERTDEVRGCTSVKCFVLTVTDIVLYEQVECLRLQSLHQEQEHRARHADCEAQLVRVRSELSRLRHSYEQLRAKRSQNKPTTTSSGGTNYKQECYTLRHQLTEIKEKDEQMEKQCRELRDLVRKREEHVEGLEAYKRQSQQNLSYLQETLRSREELIR